MKVFIWERVTNATNEYHSSGGLVVVAASLERARELIPATFCDSLFHDDCHADDGSECRMVLVRGDCEALKVEPDYVYPTYAGTDERVIVFPNAGCC